MGSLERYRIDLNPASAAFAQPALFQDLTESEQACVSRKISKLKGEGVEGDQAIARAIKECAPGKARPAKRSGHKEVDQEKDIPRYRALQAEDGTFTIFDVPIFAAHQEERSDGQTVEFGVPWLNGALKQAQLREAEGYLPPMHVSHHGDGTVEAAGKFRPQRVGPIMHDGQEVPTIFADLVGVRPDVFQRIMRGELSYRSVEILDVNRPEIDSLALLDDEVPFFRFPLLRVAVGRTLPTPTDGDARVTLAMSAVSGPVLTYTASGAGHGTAALFQFKEPSMTTPNPTKTGAAPATDPTKKNAGAEQLLMQIFSLIQQSMGPQAQQPMQPQEQPGQPPQAMAQHPQGPGPVEQQPPFPMQRATPVGGVMSQFDATPAPKNASNQSGGTIGNDPRTAELAAEGAVDGLATRMQVLEAKFTASEQQNAIERRATELATRGFSAEQIGKFRGVATEHGLDGANVYATALEDHGPSTPPSNWSGEIHGEAPDVPEVSKYAAQGPEVLATARDMYASWKRTGSDVPFDQYFESNNNADAFLGVRR